MRRRLASGLAVLVGLAGACGGRFASGTDDQAGAGSNAGGDSSSSGATSTGTAGGNHRAGQSSGGALGMAGSASGGSVSIAGTASTGGAACACPPLLCSEGSVPVPNADGCCSHCECNAKLCPAVACPSGNHLEVPPGQCCPVCVQDDCAQQRASYFDFKRQLLEKYAYGCSTASDCTIYYDKTVCGTDCGSAVWSGAVGFLQNNLQSYAAQNCSAGCMSPIPPCAVPRPPTCIDGRCE